MVDLKEWEEIINTEMFINTDKCKPLIEEIERLRKENERLHSQLKK